MAKFDHNHALVHHPSDNSGTPIMPMQLSGFDNYSMWNRAMRIQLLGKNKLGIIDVTWNKEDFGADLGHQWDRCNAIVRGCIMSSVTPELHTGIVYATSAKEIWDDLRERFDNVNTSRIYQLHKDIASLVQGTDNIPVYFSKLRNLWDEFNSIVPPPCDCPKSKDFCAHILRQKLMQFLMGLNETYHQSRS
nr:uncharacterized protein LOC104648272 [Solanum lycopersicum]